jgi:hypothetical protein
VLDSDSDEIYFVFYSFTGVDGELVGRYLLTNPIEKYGVYYLHRIRSSPV